MPSSIGSSWPGMKPVSLSSPALAGRFFTISTTWEAYVYINECYSAIVVVQLPSHVWLLAITWTVAWQASLSLTTSLNLPKFMSIESVMPSKRLILCHPLLLPLVFPSIRIFSNELAAHIQWPKYWSFSISISPSNEYSGMFSFKIDWFDLLAVQGTLKILSSTTVWKYKFLGTQAFFMVLLSHLYMITGKPYLWLYRPLLAEWHLCFLTCCLGLS